MNPIKGTLWVNPFLDEFYDWGKGKWWNTKEQFISILDNPKNTTQELFYDKSSLTPQGSYIFPQEIMNYLVEKVPAWYFDGLQKDPSGLPSLALSHMSVNAFQYGSDYDGRLISKFISAWENNTPYPPSQADFMTEEYLRSGAGGNKNRNIWDETYKDYPEELKKDGHMLETHRYYKSYIRLIDIGGLYYNSLLFTAKKNQSWCKSRKIPFLNWTLRNPREVKE
jgi:hypothetical protein